MSHLYVVKMINEHVLIARISQLKKLVLGCLLVCMGFTTQAHARDQIEIVGSSTVFPFSSSVAELFGHKTRFRTPVVESTGSGGGMKLFCGGIGFGYPDITNASRRIKISEFETCRQKGIDMVEVKIGYDGIVIANAKYGPKFNLSLRELFLAVAARVPGPSCTERYCKMIDNPYKKWSDINPALPDIAIEILGPPPTSGTRDAFQELALEGGAKTFPYLSALRSKDKNAFRTIAHHVREDGVWVDSGENDNLMVSKLVANKYALGVFGFSFLDQNGDKMKGAVIDDIPPTFDNIAKQAYKISRSLYFYVKLAHIEVIPGIKEFVSLFVDDDMIGQDGVLIDKGLIPLPPASLEKVQYDARMLKKLNM